MSIIDKVRSKPLTPAEVKAETDEASKKRSLHKGDKGADVAELQRMLSDAGFASKDKSGVFGDSTYSAVKAFQKAVQSKQGKGEKAMLVDGIVGAQTRGALRGLVGKQLLNPGFVKKDSYHASASTRPQTQIRPTNDKIRLNLLMALAGRSTTDKFGVEDAQRMAADLNAGQPPYDLPPDVLADLGDQAIAALSDGKPRADYAFAGAQMTNGDFDKVMTGILGDAMSADPAAIQLLWDRNQQAGSQAGLDAITQALAAEEDSYS